MAETKISWTATFMTDGTAIPGYTFNPWIGCTKVGPACANCYAERENKRYGWNPDGWGPGKPRKVTSDSYWHKPYVWNDQAGKSGIPRRVFCGSLCDILDDEVSQNLRYRVFEIAEETKHLTWLFLTKRIDGDREYRMFPSDWIHGDFPDNVWLGSTVWDNESAHAIIPHLLSLNVRTFVSIEPMLGPVNLEAIPYYGDTRYYLNVLSKRYSTTPSGDGNAFHHGLSGLTGIDWVICGGESGPNARPIHPNWVRSLRDQCQAAYIPFFFKQWGEWALKSSVDAPKSDFGVLGIDGEWFHQHTGWNGRSIDPDTQEAYMVRVGREKAGHLLDGQEFFQTPFLRYHLDGFPE